MWWCELLFVDMTLKFLTHLGILPDNLLFERSKIWSEVRAQSSPNMWPWKLFERRLGIIKLEHLCPIHEGILPANSFSPTSRITNSSKIFKDGNFLENLLLYKCKNSRKSQRSNGFKKATSEIVVYRIQNHQAVPLHPTIRYFSQQKIFSKIERFHFFWAHSSCNTRNEKWILRINC